MKKFLVLTRLVLTRLILILICNPLHAGNRKLWDDFLKDLTQLSPAIVIIEEIIEPNKQEAFQHFPPQSFTFPPNITQVDDGKDISDVTFDDIRGNLEDVKLEVQETIDFLKNPDKYIRFGAELPKGLLLIGEPGTGKTLIARAIAGEAQCKFFHASGSEFHKKYIGEGPQAIRELFNKARRAQKAIIFIDEIDAVAGTRSGGDDSAASNEFRAMVNELLDQMDGFNKDDSIIVIGATNFPDNIDPALKRPGRFTRNIEIPLPNRPGREDILKYYLSKIPKNRIHKEISPIEISKLTIGFSPAELKNLINESAILAARYDAQKITNAHMFEAFDRVSLGLKNKVELTPENLKRIAYHESGHALIKLLTGSPVSRMTVVPRGRALGVTFGREKSGNELLTETEIKKEICVAQGGGVAEEIIFGEKSMGISDDQRIENFYSHQIVNHLTNGIGTTGKSQLMQYEIDKAILEIRQSCLERTKKLLLDNRKTLDKLSNALLKHEILNEDEIYKISGFKKPD